MILRLAPSNLASPYQESFLDEGFILDKKIGVGQPKRMENVKILVANTAMDTDKIKIYGARVRVDSMQKVADIEKAEREKMRAKVRSSSACPCLLRILCKIRMTSRSQRAPNLQVQKIIDHGINCFVNRQLIYNFPEEIFADAGVMAIEHADFDGIERLALVTGAYPLVHDHSPKEAKKCFWPQEATKCIFKRFCTSVGGEIASTFDNPESTKLGSCKLIEEIMIGEDKLIHFSGVELGAACTIVLRGASTPPLLCCSFTLSPLIGGIMGGPCLGGCNACLR